MRALFVSLPRNHWQALLIVPLVIIAMTWPLLPRIFDRGEFWLHGGQHDRWLDIWNAWHVERVLAGQADYYFSDTIFHPAGLNLAFQHIALPHALLFIVFDKFMPADDAYNLLYLLTLLFNAFGGYLLIQHLTEDKLTATFGAAVLGLSPHFVQGTTVPDIILIGTFPLALYCFQRSLVETRLRFAALAGFCAGITAFIGMYTYVITLLALGIYGVFLAWGRWRRAEFWSQLLLFCAVCAPISLLRVYPMVADATVYAEGLQGYGYGMSRSSDVLRYIIPTGNPVTEDFLRAVFQVAPAERHNNGYLGYINLFLLACAIFYQPRWRRLAPWLAMLAFFAVLRLGDYFSFFGGEYPNIVLPERILSDWFPAVFGAINWHEYYQPGVIVPLAALACFGLAAILRSRPPAVRVAVVLLAIIIAGVEFYVPRDGRVITPDKTAYIGWLQSEADDSIKLINLPREVGNPHYFLYTQTLTGYPQADGFSSRNPQAGRSYIKGNMLLRAWDNSRSVHCLPHNERLYLAALDQLLDDGFTHVVVHNWLYGDQFVMPSFRGVPAAYNDGFVRVYRLPDLRQSCKSRQIELPRFSRFAESPAVPGLRASILSFHPSDSIDADLFTYLNSLFSDWRSLLHLYLDAGEAVMQSASEPFADFDAFGKDNQIIYALYNNRGADAAALQAHAPLEEFNLCQRDEYEDGAVIEHYLSREFSCALIASSQPLQADYDNGARLMNALADLKQDRLDVQLAWRQLPAEPHSVSLQVFDSAGVKALGQDSTIGNAPLSRYAIDVSALAPGDYAVKLIVYNFASRQSAPGVIKATGDRFERELEIAAITRT